MGRRDIAGVLDQGHIITVMTTTRKSRTEIQNFRRGAGVDGVSVAIDQESGDREDCRAKVARWAGDATMGHAHTPAQIGRYNNAGEKGAHDFESVGQTLGRLSDTQGTQGELASIARRAGTGNVCKGFRSRTDLREGRNLARKLEGIYARNTMPFGAEHTPLWRGTLLLLARNRTAVQEVGGEEHTHMKKKETRNTIAKGAEQWAVWRGTPPRLARNDIYIKH
jgi:hypothetical protein